MVRLTSQPRRGRTLLLKRLAKGLRRRDQRLIIEVIGPPKSLEHSLGQALDTQVRQQRFWRNMRDGS